MLTNAHVWREAQERLRPQMTRAQFDTWLRGTRLTTLEQGAAALAVRTTFAKELLESQYRERIEAAIAAVTGRPCSLTVVVAQGAQADESETEAARVSTRVASKSLSAMHEREAGGAAAYTRLSLFDAEPEVAARPAPGGDPVSPAGTQESDQRLARHGVAGGQGIAPPDSAAQGGPMQQPPEGHRPRDVRPAGVGRWKARAWEAGHHLPPDSAETDAGSFQAGHSRQEGRASMHTPGDSRSPRDDYDPDDYGSSSGRYPSPLSGPLPAVSASGSHAGVPAPRLNPRYSFKTFIVGSSNQLAYAASVAVGDAPGQAYNPLFLYGGVGLGKTHLLHAVGHAAAAQGQVVLYVTSETFTNDIVNAIMRRTTEEFRAKYRSVDVLLVDDIQFIAGKDSTEEEFFHTFNSLYESGRQIVICSDRPPKAIVSLEERLRSRFEWGLIADVQPPDFETRIAILRAKADIMQRHVPDEVVEYLAERIQSNIRELEGSLNRLLAFSTLQRQPLTVELAKAALATLASDARARRVTIQEVLAAVSEYYHISPEELRGKQRDKHIVVPRQVAMYLMRQETEASLMEIGQSLGGRDHSTVLHGCEKIGREVNENTALRKEIVAIRQRLLG